LGLRRSFLHSLAASIPDSIDFFGVDPENWMRAGGRLGKGFRAVTERATFVAHGLTLSLGGPVSTLKQFLDERAGAIKAGAALSATADPNELDQETLSRSKRALPIELAKLSVIGACAATEQEIALSCNTESDALR
jgi:hypothetical protein